MSEKDDSAPQVQSNDSDKHDRSDNSGMNVATRLVHAANEKAARERFAESIARVQGILPSCEVVVLSPAEISFRWRGLEFARARWGGGVSTGSQRMKQPFTTGDTEVHSESQNPHPLAENARRVGQPPLLINHPVFLGNQEIVFGAGAEERVLEDRNWQLFCDLLAALRDARHPYGPRQDRLFRLHPERWLESLVVRDVSVVDERMDAHAMYSQVPAFSAADRAMIDVLTVTREGRLAVVELKADEDIHLPLQGLDYWARVAWHHGRGEFQKFGYFAERELAGEAPLLFLVAPALHVHPATDVLLRYIAPEIEWEFVGIDERWREGVKVVFRKRPDGAGKRGPQLLSRAAG